MSEQLLVFMACRKTTRGLITCSQRAVLLMLNRETRTAHISDVFSITGQHPSLLSLLVFMMLDPAPNLPAYDPDEQTLVVENAKTGYTPPERRTYDHQSHKRSRSMSSSREGSPSNSNKRGQQEGGAPEDSLASHFQLVGRKGLWVTPAVFERVDNLATTFLDGLGLTDHVSLVVPSPLSTRSFPTQPSSKRETENEPESEEMHMVEDGPFEVQGMGERLLFRFGEWIGHGGTGDVYSATELSTGMPVALKFGGPENEEMQQEALCYAAILGPLGLAGTLRFWGLYRSDNNLVLVLDLGPARLGKFKYLSQPQRCVPPLSSAFPLLPDSSV